MGLNGSSYDYNIIPRASLIASFQPPLGHLTASCQLRHLRSGVKAENRRCLQHMQRSSSQWVLFMSPVEMFVAWIIFGSRLLIVENCVWLLDHSLLNFLIAWFRVVQRSDCTHVFLIRWFVQFGGHLDPLIDSRKGIVAWFLILALNTHSPTANSWSSWTSRSLWTRTPTFG